MSVFGEAGAQEFTRRRIGFDDEDPQTDGWSARFFPRRHTNGRHWAAARAQNDSNGSAVTGRGRHLHVPRVQHRDVAHGRQPYSGATTAFGREVGLEHPLLDVRSDPDSGIRYRQHYEVRSLAQHGASDRAVLGRDSQLAPVRHRVPGIDHQIHHDLLDLDGIGRHRPEIRGQDTLQHDVVVNQLGEQRLHTMNDGVDIERTGRLVENACLGQNLRRELRAAVSRFLNRPQVLGPGMCLVRHRLQTMGMRADDEQQIAQVVSRPCNQPCRRLCLNND